MQFEEVIIELSHNCNLRCIMCGFGNEANPFNKNKFMPFDKYKTIISQIGSIAKIVRLNGRGESSIHPDFVKIVEYTKTQFPNLGINLFSNLSFNKNKIIKTLVKNNVQVFISMDSPVEDELLEIRRGASLKLINKNIQSLEHIQKRPFIVITIQEKNIHRIFAMAQYALENNCQIIFNAVRRDNGIETFVDAVKENRDFICEEFSKTKNLYKNSGLLCLMPNQLAGIGLDFQEATQTHGTMPSCSAIEKELCILYDGTVTPCNMFNPYQYGNIFTESLDDIWKDKKRIDFINSYKDYYYCKNCANLGI